MRIRILFQRPWHSTRTRIAIYMFLACLMVDCKCLKLLTCFVANAYQISIWRCNCQGSGKDAIGVANVSPSSCGMRLKLTNDAVGTLRWTCRGRFVLLTMWAMVLISTRWTQACSFGPFRPRHQPGRTREVSPLPTIAKQSLEVATTGKFIFLTVGRVKSS